MNSIEEEKHQENLQTNQNHQNHQNSSSEASIPAPPPFVARSWTHPVARPGRLNCFFFRLHLFIFPPGSESERASFNSLALFGMVLVGH